MQSVSEARPPLASGEGKIHTPAERTCLEGRRLQAARAAYLLMFLLVAGVFAAGVPSMWSYSASGYPGVDLEYGPGKELRIIPTPGLAAAEAGNRAGDILLAIDGSPVLPGTPRMIVQRRMLGVVGTPVTLEVRAPGGVHRQIQVVRDARQVEQTGFSAGSFARYFVILDLVLVAGFLIPALIIFLRRSDDWLAMFVSAGIHRHHRSEIGRRDRADHSGDGRRLHPAEKPPAAGGGQALQGDPRSWHTSGNFQPAGAGAGFQR